VAATIRAEKLAHLAFERVRDLHGSSRIRIRTRTIKQTHAMWISPDRDTAHSEDREIA
jgi:hypothetical protein